MSFQFFSSDSTENSFDEKGRLSLPKDHRAKLANGYFIMRTWNMSPCLLLMDLEKRNETYQMFANAPRDDGALRDYITWLFSQTHTAQLDSSNRIYVPQGLRRDLKFGKQAVIVGTADMIEIWPKEAFELNRKTYNKMALSAFERRMSGDETRADGGAGDITKKLSALRRGEDISAESRSDEGDAS